MLRSSTRLSVAYSPAARLQEGAGSMLVEEDCLLVVVDSQPGVVDCWLAEAD